MRATVRRSEIGGVVSAPPSKSYTHRALICSALAEGTSQIVSPLYSDDTEATGGLLRGLGIAMEEEEGLWRVEGGGLSWSSSDLFCRESGATLRFMTAVCALLDGRSRLTCGPSLSRRPIGPLLDGLGQLGVECICHDGFPPVTVNGFGKLRGGETAVQGDISSQFISALLLVAPLTELGASITVTTPLESKPYVSMTVDTQRRFGVEVEAQYDLGVFRVRRQGYRPTKIVVEGDWSSGAYILGAGALAGRLTVRGLNASSLQADAAILGILKRMGARAEAGGDGVSIEQSRLAGIEVDLSDCPDLFPIVSVLCAAAEGESVLRGVRRLRYKESDRLAAMIDALRRMGIGVTTREDSMIIIGGSPRGGRHDPSSDHRIAMALAILGLISEDETTILDAECVAKSYPGFWDALEALGANLGRMSDEQ